MFSSEVPSFEFGELRLFSELVLGLLNSLAFWWERKLFYSSELF